MPIPIARAIEVSEHEQALLEANIRRANAPQWLVTRSKIILQAGRGVSNQQIAQELQITRNTVIHWRERWRVGTEKRRLGTTAELGQVIETQLRDAYRSGSPGKFSAEQITSIIALACEAPQRSGYPISRWTPHELAVEAVKRGIVESISERQVGRFLK
jgi:transposase